MAVAAVEGGAAWRCAAMPLLLLMVCVNMMTAKPLLAAAAIGNGSQSQPHMMYLAASKRHTFSTLWCIPLRCAEIL